MREKRREVRSECSAHILERNDVTNALISRRPSILTNDNVHHTSPKIQIHEYAPDFLQF